MRLSTFSIFAFVVSISLLFPLTANAGFENGSWRLELSGGPGFTVGGRDREGDYLLKGTVEYEIPTTPHLSLGLRILPLFVYGQDDGDTVYGGGGGVSARLYAVKSEYRGLFAEGSAHIIGHENRIAGNSSNLNFLTGLGVGYKFAKGWHTVLKWEHISNAGLGEANSGADTVTLGFGYTF
ncbi:MAG: acyloxyacyl hydrolase [Candidatus Hydrogenedentes bacterium]|jgi:hypothetical protein|nr:acyloxyacyl hydrolase [Candidatus Hydrogenedentota bacterium]